MDKTQLFSLAEKAVMKGQYEKALEGLESILRADPNDLKALNRAADLYLKKENIEKAIEYLKRVGSVYSKDGFYSKAVAVYKRILKIDQASSKAALIQIHEQLATLYGQLGLVSDAMSHFSIVVDFYDQTGEQELLLQVLKKVSDLDPYNVDNQLKLAELFVAQKKESSAIETLEHLTENVRSKGNIGELVRVFERWIELFPLEVVRLEELVQLYLKANEPKKALSRIQTAFRSNPKSSPILELLSSTFRAMKQPDKSRAVDLELIKIYRNDGEVEKALVVEERIKNKASELPAHQSGATRRATPDSPGLEVLHESADAGEELIQSLDIQADEKKILAECDVYVKYGLLEKAHEVLTNKLGQYPQSLALRWRLKCAAQELEKLDETTHLLSEIVMLARTKNLESWVSLASKELQSLDASHPALMGTAALKSVSKPPAPANEAFMEPSIIRDFEPSEISIVVEEDSTDDPDVSDIYYRELEVLDENFSEKPVQKAAEKSPTKAALEKRQPEKQSSKPIAPIAEPSRVAEVEENFEAENSDVAEVLLSEADFTEAELEKLSANFAADETPIPKAAPIVIANSDDDSAIELQLEVSDPHIEMFENLEEIREENRQEKPDENAVELSILSDDSAEVLSDEDFEVRQGMEEVEFFKAQGLKDEAESLLKSLRIKFPNHSEWSQKTVEGSQAPQSKTENPIKKSSSNQKTVEVQSLGTKMKLTVQEDDRAEDSDSDFFDFAGELNREMSAESAHESPAEIRDVFNAFKKGVAESIAAEDWQTHFDLGIAYREMGLMDDAIEEFKLVSKVDDQKISALYQLGVCEMGREKYAEAKAYFDTALKEPKLDATTKISCSYELAEALLRLNNPSKAMKLLEEVQRTDPDYREVNDRIAEVTKTLKLSAK